MLCPVHHENTGAVVGAWVRVGAVWENGWNIAKINGPRIFMSEGREEVDITGFEGDIVISLSTVGTSVHNDTPGNPHEIKVFWQQANTFHLLSSLD